jgi:nucleotide-binding universal stress UspA family protein
MRINNKKKIRMKTTRMKKVLIALDYNPTAQKVAEAGFDLAKAMNAEIVLLHVTTDPVYYASTEYSPILGYSGNIGTDQVDPTSAEGMKKASQQFLDKTKSHLGDEAIQTRVTEGDFAESIIKTARDVHADIIVIGSHSRQWLENIVMGSVTQHVLNQTTIPLFIIPTKRRK